MSPRAGATVRHGHGGTKPNSQAASERLRCALISGSPRSGRMTRTATSAVSGRSSTWRTRSPGRLSSRVRRVRQREDLADTRRAPARFAVTRAVWARMDVGAADAHSCADAGIGPRGRRVVRARTRPRRTGWLDRPLRLADPSGDKRALLMMRNGKRLAGRAPADRRQADGRRRPPARGAVGRRAGGA